MVVFPVTPNVPPTVVFPVTPNVPPTVVFPVILLVPYTFSISVDTFPPIPVAPDASATTNLPLSQLIPLFAYNTPVMVVFPVTPNVPDTSKLLVICSEPVTFNI